MGILAPPLPLPSCHAKALELAKGPGPLPKPPFDVREASSGRTRAESPVPQGVSGPGRESHSVHAGIAADLGCGVMGRSPRAQGLTASTVTTPANGRSHTGDTVLQGGDMDRMKDDAESGADFRGGNYIPSVSSGTCLSTLESAEASGHRGGDGLATTPIVTATGGR